MNDRTHNLMKYAMLAVALLCSAAFGGDVVTLRGTAVVSGEALRLADVAMLEGDYAAQFAEVEVGTINATQDAVTIRLADVRRSLESKGANWAKLTLRGSLSVSVKRAAAVQAEVGAADTVAVANPHGVTEIAPGIAATSLRDHITAFIIAHAGVPAADLKITFDEQAAGEALAASTRNFRFEIETVGSDVIGRVPLTVRSYRGTELSATERLSVTVQVRHMALVVARPIARGQTITDADIELKEVWLDSLIKQPLSDAKKVVGLRATGLMRVGSLVHEGDVRPVELVSRGQIIRVQSVSGPFAITFQARALDDGVQGQTITVRNDNTREQFTATVTAPGEAVLVTAETDALASTEENAR